LVPKHRRTLRKIAARAPNAAAAVIGADSKVETASTPSAMHCSAAVAGEDTRLSDGGGGGGDVGASAAASAAAGPAGQTGSLSSSSLGP
jgi:hypothetical protein